MITKIQLQGVASYKNSTSLDTDKKINIIYGLNGTGKSTLSNYLYNPDDIKYSNCSTTKELDETILVYNQKFIQDNFYEEDNLKGIFSLSKENKEIEEKITASTKEVETIEESMKSELKLIQNKSDSLFKLKDDVYEKLFDIKRNYAGGDRVLEYCLDGLKRKEPLFDFISKIPLPQTKPNKSMHEIKIEVESISGDSAQIYNLLPLLKFDSAYIEKENIFKNIVIGNNESPIASLIVELNNSDWVKQGLGYIKENIGSDICPFCQEKTLTNSLIKQITEYFDKTYEESVSTISSYLQSYTFNANQLNVLDIYISHPFSEQYLGDLRSAYTQLVGVIEKNIEKIKNKLTRPSLTVELYDTINYLLNFNDIITNINNRITIHNTKIENSASEKQKLKNQFWQLMRWDYNDIISKFAKENKSICDELGARKIEYQNLELKVTDIKTFISNLQKSVVNIDEAIANINNGLLELGITDFSIEKHNEFLYRIIRTENNKADFISLSEGEKMIISFLYFRELCRGRKNSTEVARKKILIIDDPISSLSHIYVYNVGQMIKSEFFMSKAYEQVFVLTHSLYFFYELADANHKRRKDTQKLFRLSKNINGTNISPMKYEEIQNDYQSYWAVINDDDQPPALIANCMRNIIEYFFNFVQKSDLSNVIQKPELQANRFQSFCRYINRESHSLGQNIFDYKEFNYDDFKDGLKLLFEVTGYPEHYEKMVSINLG